METEIPVASESPASVTPRSLRSRLSRGPTPVSTASSSASWSFCSVMDPLQNQQTHLSISRQRAKTSKATAGRPPKRSAAAFVVPVRKVRQYASGSWSVSTSI